MLSENSMTNKNPLLLFDSCCMFSSNVINIQLNLKKNKFFRIFFIFFLVGTVGIEPTCNQLPFQQGISLSGYAPSVMDKLNLGLLRYTSIEIMRIVKLIFMLSLISHCNYCDGIVVNVAEHYVDHIYRKGIVSKFKFKT